MTRPVTDVLEVLQLSIGGLSKRAISIRTGISRAAIREWLADPARALERGRRAGLAPARCDAQCGLWKDMDEAAYSYLLGMYLGDGWISEHERAFSLRIFCGACDAIDVHWTQANRRTISVARREDVFHLDSFIGPKR